VRYFAPAPSSPLLAHQVEGLSNPLDPDTSTASGHFTRIVRGIGSVKDQPLGHGVGSVTLAARRFGGVNRNTESDPGNVSRALGLPGLVLWIALVVLGLRLAYRTALHRRDGLSLVALGMLTLLVLHWLNGAEYAVAMLPWLVLGWLDRGDAETRRHPRGS